jgi:multiple antibiotic resistance protein
MHDFWLCFVPLFFAVDAIGTLPMFIGLTEGIERARLRKIIFQSVGTALIVALLFLAIGKMVLNLLGITVGDFMIAGGVLLFMFSVSDLLSTEKRQRHIDPESVGAVPIGVPLIAGPAVLTTIILLVGEHSYLSTITATVVNMLIAGIVFRMSGSIIKVLGNVGAKITSKLASLLLCAIGVMMVRKGVVMLFAAGIG